VLCSAYGSQDNRSWASVCTREIWKLYLSPGHQEAVAQGRLFCSSNRRKVVIEAIASPSPYGGRIALKLIARDQGRRVRRLHETTPLWLRTFESLSCWRPCRDRWRGVKAIPNVSLAGIGLQQRVTDQPSFWPTQFYKWKQPPRVLVPRRWSRTNSMLLSWGWAHEKRGCNDFRGSAVARLLKFCWPKKNAVPFTRRALRIFMRQSSARDLDIFPINRPAWTVAASKLLGCGCGRPRMLHLSSGINGESSGFGGGFFPD